MYWYWAKKCTSEAKIILLKQYTAFLKFCRITPDKWKMYKCFQQQPVAWYYYHVNSRKEITQLFSNKNCLKTTNHCLSPAPWGRDSALGNESTFRWHVGQCGALTRLLLSSNMYFGWFKGNKRILWPLPNLLTSFSIAYQLVSYMHPISAAWQLTCVWSMGQLRHQPPPEKRLWIPGISCILCISS